MTHSSGAGRAGLMIALALALTPGLGRAASILLVDRSIRIQADYYDTVHGVIGIRTSTAADTVGYGPWHATLTDGIDPVSASQSSRVDSLTLDGTASVDKGNTPTFAESKYRVVYSVDDDTPNEFAVDNIDIDPFGTAFPSGVVKLDRVDPGNFELVFESIYSVQLYRVVAPIPAGGPDFADEGVLPPGTFRLDFRLQIPGSHSHGEPASAGFSLAMVPEPDSLLLAAVGLVILGLRRPLRRYAKQASS